MMIGAPRARRLVPVQRWTRALYRQSAFEDPTVFQEVKETLMAFAKALPPSVIQTTYCADDTMVWGRTLGFLADADFIAAHGPYADLAHVCAKLWRTYTSAWAVRSALRLPGAIVDLGCYDGVAADIRYRYAGIEASQKAWYLYDVFDHAPDGLDKWDHGPQLLSAVRARFSARPNVTIVSGHLPETLATCPSAIACALLDLNDAHTEVATLERIYEAIVPGGMIVLDDYGDSHYHESYQRERAFFASRGLDVYECPTGQGMVIKR